MVEYENARQFVSRKISGIKPADALDLFRGRVDQGDRASFVIASPDAIGTKQSLVSAVRHTSNQRWGERIDI